MSTFRRARPSPALVVAVIALVVAMGGTAYAGFRVPRNSVGSNQLKKNAVTNKKIANGAVTGAKIKLSTLGTVPSANTANTANTANSATHATSADDATTVGGEPIRWLLVNKSGSIVAQSGGFTVTSHPSAGIYVIGAGSTVTGHAIMVSDSIAGDTAKRGVAVAGPCGTGPDGIDCSGLTPAGLNDGTHIFVGTTATDNTTTADHSFYLMLY
jgi:hypothetical protein